jgi:hypothetical protein
MERRSMRPGLSFVAIIFLAFLFLPGKALGAEFVIVGPRAMGMGGAGVAITTDALATYWNPAGLAMTQTVDIRIVGSAQAIDRLGIADAVGDLENFDTSDTSPANVAKAQDIANRINRPGANTSFNGAAGVYVKGHFGEHAFGFNISNVPTGGGFLSSPVGVSCSPNPNCAAPGPISSVSVSGAMAVRALEARQAAFSYAYAFADKTFAIGVTAKIIQGAAYNGTQNLVGGQEIKLSDSTASMSAPSIDPLPGCALALWPRTSTNPNSMRRMARKSSSVLRSVAAWHSTPILR